VSNGSFEQFIQCPDNPSQLDRAVGWSFAQGSTDYFNSCETSNFVSVPINHRGYQFACDGDAYIGMFNYDSIVKTYREPATTQLSQSLTIGQKYYVSFKTVLTLDSFASCYATNKMGVLFSTIQYTLTNPAPVNNFAHIYTNSIISDTANWSLIYGDFIADSAYSYVTIVNFFDSTQTQTLKLLNYYASTASYYFVDDLKVSTDSAYVVGLDRLFESNTPLVYPNPSTGVFEISSRSEYYLIEVYNTLGELKYIGNSKKEIDLSSFESQICVLFIKTEAQVYRSKLIINH
jgi:hypothetical protein